MGLSPLPPSDCRINILEVRFTLKRRGQVDDIQTDGSGCSGRDCEVRQGEDDGGVLHRTHASCGSSGLHASPLH